MKYIKLFEAFKPHDPYELMIIPPNKKAELIMWEINSDKPNLNLVSDLIVLGANVNWQDENNNGWTPLHMAAWNGRVEIARMLIDAGANVNVQNEWSNTPLHWAASRGQVKIVRMLIDAGARKDIQNNKGQIPFDLARTPELKKLLKPNLSESFDSYDTYELMIIPPNRKAEMIMDEIKKSYPKLNLVNDLIVLGVNVDWQNEDDQNRTLLHYAVKYKELEIARMLIGAGADVNVQDNRGMTPLHWAASNGQEELARMLIEASADVNGQDEIGQTPLHWAAEFTNVEFVRMLIEEGSRKDIRNTYGETPYDLANDWQMEELLAIE